MSLNEFVIHSIGKSQPIKMENVTVMENSTLFIKNSSLGNTTTENSTIYDDHDALLQFSTIEIILALFNLLMYFLSFISVIIHLSKFFNAKQKQNLQIKNLTSYVGCLFLVYSLIFIYIITDAYTIHRKTFQFIDLYLHIAESILLLVMACYTCMCIIVCRKGYHIPFSDDTQFLIYSSIGWIFPLFLAGVIFSLESSHQPKIIIILLFRLLAVIPFFASIWYIRSIGWNRTNAIKNFVIHLRLLILTGVISIIPNTVYGILSLFDEEEDAALTKIFGQIADVFYYPMGFIVGLCFTFRKGTFENKIENPIEMTNGYVTDMANVVDNEDQQ